nr:unnamed protein product [Callosobruchus analis]CAI5836267.1 unnamed protein product [Callosobruchus analis]
MRIHQGDLPIFNW